jgi:hypothetical protein
MSDSPKEQPALLVDSIKLIDATLKVGEREAIGAMITLLLCAGGVIKSPTQLDGIGFVMNILLSELPSEIKAGNLKKYLAEKNLRG